MIACLCAGCASFSGVAQVETLSAENVGFVTEAAEIRSTIVANETQVLATSVAAETQVAQENVVNAVILQTVRAGDPPTIAVSAQIDRSAIQPGATADPSLFGEAGAGSVIETYVASAVRDEDGCGEDQRSQFPEGTSRLFAVQRYETIPGNTLVSVQFAYEGATALEDELVVTAAQNDFCVWFFLEPFSMGRWSVQFYSNGAAVGQRVDFTVGG